MTTLNDLTPGTWNLDPAHSAINFAVRHLMVSKVRGTFAEFSATTVAAQPVSDSSIEVTVQAASVDTNNADRDAHLKNADFFDVEKFPTITFTATAITETTITGDLTLKGVTKPVTFDYEFGGTSKDPWGGTRAGFAATATIDRTEFDLSFNAPLETGGLLLGEKIELVLDLEFVQA